MASRIVVLRKGNVEQIGAPLDLYDRPANKFVAGFLGSPAMNFLSGRISRDGAAVEIEAGISLPLPNSMPGAEGREVVYGIRPEHLNLSEAATLKIRVNVVEPTGPETQVFGSLGQQQIVGLFRERIMPATGSELALAVDANLVHLFDPQTGQRLN